MLAGNHDIGFLDFLRTPDPEGLFMRFGGVQTALSYGVSLTADASWFGKMETMRRGTSGPGRGDAARPCRLPALAAVFADLGDFFFCHAGIRPGIALDKQNPQDLIWIRDVFHNHPGLFPKIVVHGHTPVPEAEVMANRVNVDTLAWQSGMLTALVVDGADKRILTMAMKEPGTTKAASQACVRGAKAPAFSEARR